MWATCEFCVVLEGEKLVRGQEGDKPTYSELYWPAKLRIVLLEVNGRKKFT